MREAANGSSEPFGAGEPRAPRPVAADVRECRHRGRRSAASTGAGERFRDGDDYLVALTYSSQVDWVRNVLGAGGCELETGGRVVRLTDPELFVDRERRLMPFPVRQFLAW